MRVCNVAICTLTALVTSGIVAEAKNEIIDLSDSSEAQNQNFVFEDDLSTQITSENMVASPEVLEIATWSDHNPQGLDSSNQDIPPINLEKTQITSLEPTELDSQTTEIAENINEFLPSESMELDTENLENPQEISGQIASELGVIKAEKNINNNFISEADPCIVAVTSNLESENQENQPEINLISQANNENCPRPREIEPLVIPEVGNNGASPALSINIPVGYGADNNTTFINTNYQASVREDPGSVFNGGIGVGLGDASEAVGTELSYAFATNDNFGEGGFNAKLHHRFEDDLAVAIGWNGLLNIGRNDFEHSKYGAITKVFRLQDSLDDPFSRIAFTAGVGDGQFRSNGAVKAGDNNVNVFGNMAVRMFRPVSFIAEWTGQDVGLGLSIAPFENIPLVITPAVRDLAGNDYNPRFVVSMGLGFQW